MNELIGYVNKIDTRHGTGKTGKPYTMYNVTLTQKDGIQKVVGWGFTAPTFPENVWIRTTATQKGAYLNYDGGPIAQAAGTQPNISEPTAPAAAPSAARGVNARDKYWEDKDVYDKEEREPRIQYQAARRDAIELVGYLISADALPVSEAKSKGAKAERFDQVLDFVNKLTVQLYNDTRTLRVLEGVQDAPPVAPSVADIPEVAPAAPAASSNPFDEELFL